MKVLMSIKPEFANRILSGEKEYEYRKTIFTRSEVNKVLIYATMPIGKIIGEFEIEEIISETPEKLWEKTSIKSGITKSFYNKYFDGKTIAHAIKVKNVKKYLKAMELNDLKEGVKAPQSFLYIE